MRGLSERDLWNLRAGCDVLHKAAAKLRIGDLRNNGGDCGVHSRLEDALGLIGAPDNL
jgi:hypothetical protein